ncbi:MAG: hypothetical protein US53_C0051G0007 [Candidatus Woesebacteria bacterium GW2011_GWA1_37_7]|uniref:Uncharacterized protein n=1 Tax=Candidatus Woesebacteria bacterium GW2011_GWA1_37_7 TaxID=1618545 RepID=A0A0G0H2R7_9BACT|nr:MAG: hypothetical protein US53_C0051G0007 [Candidatus Woesebacteria bacterium GW2011_GWA1_37_7]
MSIFDRIETESRDDMHSLYREGVNVDRRIVDKRLGRLDRPHIFEDGRGEIVPATKLRLSGNGVQHYGGRTLKLGPAHSHDSEHLYHFLENIENPAKDLLQRFRKNAFVHHQTRRLSRDR